MGWWGVGGSCLGRAGAGGRGTHSSGVTPPPRPAAKKRASHHTTRTANRLDHRPGWRARRRAHLHTLATSGGSGSVRGSRGPAAAAQLHRCPSRVAQRTGSGQRRDERRRMDGRTNQSGRCGARQVGAVAAATAYVESPAPLGRGGGRRRYPDRPRRGAAWGDGGRGRRHEDTTKNAARRSVGPRRAPTPTQQQQLRRVNSLPTRTSPRPSARRRATQQYCRAATPVQTHPKPDKSPPAAHALGGGHHQKGRTARRPAAATRRETNQVTRRAGLAAPGTTHHQLLL